MVFSSKFVILNSEINQEVRNVGIHADIQHTVL